MKHTIKITLILVFTFLAAQVMGLVITDQYIDVEKTTPEQRAEGNITWVSLPYDVERPEVEPTTSFFYIVAAILIGTGLVLLIIKFKKFRLWTFWYFISVLICLTVAFAAFFQHTIAFTLALVLAAYKIFRPNIFVHNLVEIFLYGGLAAIFVPIMNLFAVFMLLLIISIYDFWAVFRTKHMVTLAKFQTNTKSFAGVFIPYRRIKKPKPGETTVRRKVTSAVLGGGDIGFPLLFTGVVMKTAGLVKVLIIPVFAAIALLLLLVFAKKDKFYPAMPILSAGCVLGYLVLLLL